MLYKLLLLAFVSEYFRPQSYWPILGALKITTLLPLAVIGLSALSQPGIDRISNTAVLAHRNSKWLYYFMALLVISMFVADVTLYAKNALDTAFAFFLLYFVTVKEVTTVAKLKGVFGALIVAHLLLIIFNPELVTHPEARSYLNHAYLGDGNDFALSLCILVPMALFIVQDSSSRWVKGTAIFALIVCVLAIVGTQSRGGTLALSAVLLYQWWRSSKKIAGLFAMAALVVVALMYAPTEYFDRMHSLQNYQEEGSAQGRITAWKASLRMAADHPITGVGAGHFPVKFGTQYFPPEMAEGAPWLTAHSIYFLILGELGIPGIVFLIVVIFGTMWQTDRKLGVLGALGGKEAQRLRRLYLCLNSSMLAYAVAGAFLSALYYPHIFILLAMFACMEEIQQRDFVALHESGFGNSEPESVTGRQGPPRSHRA
jgi:putative inorganic carbon (HCO3(-)) transporter